MTTLGSGFVDRARVRLGVQEVYSPADTSDPCTFPHPSCSVSSPSPPPADSTTPARGGIALAGVVGVAQTVYTLVNQVFGEELSS